MSRLAMGIDLGTTAAKAVVLDGAGAVVASGAAPTRLLTGPGGLVEQEVAEVWAGAVRAARQAVGGVSTRRDIRALALSSQGGTLILLDGNGTPIGNAISWMDTRPAALGTALLGGRDDAFFYDKTGWSLRLGCLPLAQLIRLRIVGGASLPRVRFVDSYVVERLTGEAATNPSDAAIATLYNVRERRWDPGLLELAGVAAEALPRVVPSGTPLGPIRREAAEELGLSPDAIVVAGGHDQYCAAFGAGCRAAGDAVVSCGTAWVLLTMTTEARFDQKARLAPAEAVTPGLWGLLGSCSSVGAAVDWFRRAASAGPELSFEALEAAAAAVKPSSDAPLFLPPGSGGGGAFVGLALHHTFGHLARAVLEGPALSVRALLDRMRAAGCAPATLRAVGGATRSRPWMQILSDAVGLPLEVAGTQDVAAYGAARLAGEATGIIPHDAPRPAPAAHVEPDPGVREAYDTLYERFRRRRRGRRRER
ncbi:MAG TPA: FGGY family carbohydrate kinase [Planctomycetota bacterium]|nr:FGGY family carbohydrate kinase [Planctomycetota bacterium]